MQLPLSTRGTASAWEMAHNDHAPERSLPMRCCQAKPVHFTPAKVPSGLARTALPDIPAAVPTPAPMTLGEIQLALAAQALALAAFSAHFDLQRVGQREAIALASIPDDRFLADGPTARGAYADAENLHELLR